MAGALNLSDMAIGATTGGGMYSTEPSDGSKPTEG
jgi:hypothetical protein